MSPLIIILFLFLAITASIESFPYYDPDFYDVRKMVMEQKHAEGAKKEGDFDICMIETDCEENEFCFQNDLLKYGICIEKIAKTVDSAGFNPMDVRIVNEQPIALP